MEELVKIVYDMSVSYFSLFQFASQDSLYKVYMEFNLIFSLILETVNTLVFIS